MQLKTMAIIFFLIFNPLHSLSLSENELSLNGFVIGEKLNRSKLLEKKYKCDKPDIMGGFECQYHDSKKKIKLSYNENTLRIIEIEFTSKSGLLDDYIADIDKYYGKENYEGDYQWRNEKLYTGVSLNQGTYLLYSIKNYIHGLYKGDITLGEFTFKSKLNDMKIINDKEIKCLDKEVQDKNKLAVIKICIVELDNSFLSSRMIFLGDILIDVPLVFFNEKDKLKVLKYIEDNHKGIKYKINDGIEMFFFSGGSIIFLDKDALVRYGIPTDKNIGALEIYNITP